MKRREQATGMPDLKPETVAVLLGGWSADPPPELPRSSPDDDQHYLQLYGIGGIAKLWREHEGWLREQARLWGREPTFTLGDVPMCYGERVAHGGQE